MLQTATLIAFVTTADGERALGFYRDVLGLRLVADEPFAVVFDANGVTLRVARADTVHPAPYTVLGWRVDDVAATVDGLTARHVAFERFGSLEQDDRGIWTSPAGARIAWFRDPDGNLLSLTQLAS